MAIKRSVRLECGDCKQINYLTFKNSKKHPEKLELKKHCEWCNAHKVHKETKRK